MKFIKFTLSAPLQSWGEDARWDQRTTAVMPTKSAVIGILGCCLGLLRGSEQLSRLDEQIYMAVRAERPGVLMTDFHTVQGTEGVFLNAKGVPRGGGGTIITPKQYLQDAIFTVFIWGEESILDTCFQAMMHPKWAVYLGRKSCPPAVPLLPQIVYADTPLDAVKTFTDTEKARSSEFVQVETDIQDVRADRIMEENYHEISRRDAVCRADKNEYSIRRVYSFAVPSGGK